MRRLIAFPCEDDTLLATLDEASGTAGLLIVSGGNEIRIGAHRGMALLAQRLATRGIPVFRFDRRGIGDSTGENGGFRLSGPDIACAATAFRAATGIDRLVAFGNCDAATALVLFGRAAGIERLILANPWTIEPSDDMPPAAAIRARYAAKLKDPCEWLRLLRGGVDLGKLAGGLRKVAHTSSEPAPLAERLALALKDWPDRCTVLLAAGDATAIAYRDAMTRLACDVPALLRDTDSHSFARDGDAAWLEAQIVAALVD